MGAFESACKLLGLDVEDAIIALTKQNMFVEGSVIVKQQSYAQVRMF
jgi:myosin heavy subunit